MMEEMEGRVVGEYMVGPQKIGTGSFAVVWRGRHLHHGLEVAVKEIEKRRLSAKIKDSLMKEITILRHVSHPNIVKLHDALQTEDKIYLILEYCTGGDLAGYIHRYGKVSESVARHFMRQLASGLQVLRENNLIHRDLKPQNLLLCTKDETPVLKIGDFGFARYLTPQGLADTLCGSPLYMAPEIIQNKKYDAKADLWSVGAILFQLVTGRPPFEGNTQYQLFQNVLASDELQFPQDVIAVLHSDCVSLCRSLLRRNPVERLTFEEFFNHKFMALLRSCESSPKFTLNTTNDDLGNSFGESSNSLNTDNLKNAPAKQCLLRESTPKVVDHLEFTQNTAKDNLGDSFSESSKSNMRNLMIPQGFLKSSTPKVTDSLESIEEEYVLVHAHFASMESLSSSLETTLRENPTAKLPSYKQKNIEVSTPSLIQSGDNVNRSVCGVESMGTQMAAASSVSQASNASKNVKGTSDAKGTIINPSSRLKILYRYLYVLTELAKEKFNAGFHLDSFSLELVALAVWKEALRVCNLWMSSTSLSDPLKSYRAIDCLSGQKAEQLPLNLSESFDFRKPLSVCSWMERGFILAYDRAEKISKSFQDGEMVMPDSMEIIFQTALSAGKSGAVDELMGHRERAAALYSKAITLLTFVSVEASSLPLNPPILISTADQQRIHTYITNLRAHLSHSEVVEPHFKGSQNSLIQ